MSHKRIEYSDHATSRMKTRRISRSDVKTLRFTGEPNPARCRPEGKRHARTARIRGRDAEVVYLENGERFLIVTVYWVGDE